MIFKNFDEIFIFSNFLGFLVPIIHESKESHFIKFKFFLNFVEIEFDLVYQIWLLQFGIHELRWLFRLRLIGNHASNRIYPLIKCDLKVKCGNLFI